MGGLSLLSSYVKIIRNTTENLIWLDSGDQFTGTLESYIFNGQTITKAFNYMGLNLTSPGNHEFDYGIQSYNKRLLQ